MWANTDVPGGGEAYGVDMAWGRHFRVATAAGAVLAAACLVAASPVQAASDSAHAATSKAKHSKACKKKHKKGVSCKKPAGRRASLPAIPRNVTLTWDSTADIDLQIYDMNGRHSGLANGGIVNGIPGATHSSNDTDGFGPETFDDPSGRKVGYLVCYVSGPYANVTLTDSGTGGARYTAGLGPTEPGKAYTKSVGWGYLPVGAHC
jgi:hypothetical protein